MEGGVARGRGGFLLEEREGVYCIPGKNFWNSLCRPFLTASLTLRGDALMLKLGAMVLNPRNSKTLREGMEGGWAGVNRWRYIGNALLLGSWHDLGQGGYCLFSHSVISKLTATWQTHSPPHDTLVLLWIQSQWFCPSVREELLLQALHHLLGRLDTFSPAFEP